MNTFVGNRIARRHPGSGRVRNALGDTPSVHTDSHSTATVNTRTASTMRTGNKVTDNTDSFARSYGVRLGVALTKGFTIGRSDAMKLSPRTACLRLVAGRNPLGCGGRVGGWISSSAWSFDPA